MIGPVRRRIAFWTGVVLLSWSGLFWVLIVSLAVEEPQDLGDLIIASTVMTLAGVSTLLIGRRKGASATGLFPVNPPQETGREDWGRPVGHEQHCDPTTSDGSPDFTPRMSDTNGSSLPDSVRFGPIETLGIALLRRPGVTVVALGVFLAALTGFTSALRASSISSPAGGTIWLVGLMILATLLIMQVFPRLDLPYVTVFLLQWVLGVAIYLLTWAWWLVFGSPSWWLLIGVGASSLVLTLIVTISREVTTE